MLLNTGKSKKKVIAYAGKAGSGKTFQLIHYLETHKPHGRRLAIRSYADPLKNILEKLGFRKSGYTDEGPEPFLGNDVKNLLFKVLFNSLKKYTDNPRILSTVLKTHIGAFTKYYMAMWQSNPDSDDYKYFYRKAITLLGTEIGRSIDNEIWIKALITSINNILKQTTIDRIIVDDVRFLNEYTRTDEILSELNIPFEVYGVVVPNEIRAERQGITLEQVLEHNEHPSEKEVDDILLLLPEDRIIFNY